MQVRHYVILLDIDETLIDFHASSKEKTVWNGSLELWREYIRILQECLNTDKTQVHIGIATSKLKSSKKCKIKFNGDVLSAVVLEDEDYFANYGRSAEYARNKGLKHSLNPNLIFFTSGECKVVNALDFVKGIIQKQFHRKNIIIDKTNIMLIDDYKDACDLATASGYQSICVAGLTQIDQAQREIFIGSLFLNIFEKFNLPIPLKMLKAVGALDVDGNTEMEILDVEEELINYMCSAEETGINTLSQLILSKKRKSEEIACEVMVVNQVKRYVYDLHGSLYKRGLFYPGRNKHRKKSPEMNPQHYMFRR